MNRLEATVKQRGRMVFAGIDHAAGVDLPLKTLVSENHASRVWLGHNKPALLTQRYGVPSSPAVENLREALSAVVDTAVARGAPWLEVEYRLNSRRDDFVKTSSSCRCKLPGHPLPCRQT